jgi:NADP-dependent 3-hydroxy acid dehydrogenase YdfG
VLTEFAGRTAVVTGAASGIGFGLASRCVERGMNVAMLDVEADALADAATRIGSPERVYSATVDASDGGAMAAAGEEVVDRFGAVHLLCNNAGVSITGPMWAMTEDDCRWAVGVNLLGIMNGVRAFVPEMLERGDEGHVVNTSSLVGLLPMPETPLYAATKAGVIAMSEAMRFDFEDAGARLGVSVLCPGLVNTNIMTSTRNRPDGLGRTGALPVPDAVREVVTTGADPLDVADRALAAVTNDNFYVLTNDAGRPDIAARGESIAQLANPPRPNPASAQADPAPPRSRQPQA